MLAQRLTKMKHVNRRHSHSLPNIYLRLGFVSIFLLYVVSIFFLGKWLLGLEETIQEDLSVLEICRGRQFHTLNFSHDFDWTVVLTINSGFLDFFKNWWHYYERLIIDTNLVIIAEDSEAYQILLKMELPNAVVLQSESNVTQQGAVDYPSPLYNKLVTSRPSRLLSILCCPQIPSKKVIYADVDAVWVKDPIPYVEEALYGAQHLDIVAQNDIASGYCTGFLGMKRNDRIIHLLYQWELNVVPTLPNQKKFQDAMLSPLLTHLGLRHGVLPISQFPPGYIYFNPDISEDERRKAVVVHNNWIVGSQNKTTRFKKWDLWHPTDAAV